MTKRCFSVLQCTNYLKRPVPTVRVSVFLTLYKSDLEPRNIVTQYRIIERIIKDNNRIIKSLLAETKRRVRLATNIFSQVFVNFYYCNLTRESCGWESLCDIRPDC